MLKVLFIETEDKVIIEIIKISMDLVRNYKVQFFCKYSFCSLCEVSPCFLMMWIVFVFLLNVWIW